jgi:hypothetical protein
MHRPRASRRTVGSRFFIWKVCSITKDDQFSAEESQRRFEKLVKAALNTPPKPLKSMTPKGVHAQSKKRRQKAKSAAWGAFVTSAETAPLCA